jgi:hypothetical protein
VEEEEEEEGGCQLGGDGRRRDDDAAAHRAPALYIFFCPLWAIDILIARASLLMVVVAVNAWSRTIIGG